MLAFPFKVYQSLVLILILPILLLESPVRVIIHLWKQSFLIRDYKKNLKLYIGYWKMTWKGEDGE